MTKTPREKLKRYSVYLSEAVVDEAKEQLEIGQKLSPVLNHLLKNWTEEKIKIHAPKGEKKK